MEDIKTSNVSGENVIQGKTKFCKHCGGKIAEKAVICPLCGCQVEEIAKPSASPQVVVNNSNQNRVGGYGGYEVGADYKNKWVALALCFFLGIFGAHRFYEGKIGTGILYLFTGGLLGIGVVVDFLILLFKPTHYIVRR